MATQVQQRRGTTAEHASFTGAVGEITVDTTKDTAVVHDGSTAGGHPLLKEAAIGVSVQAYDANLPAGNTILVDGDVGVVVQAYDATTLKSADIGTSVQAYDADTAKLDVAQTFTAQQTFGELKETVYTLGTSGSIALDPANGSIQISVLTGAPTFSDSLEAGQTVVLMLENGASYSVTWPTTTWVTSGGNVAPTLTAKDTLVFWKVSTTLYGAYVGSYA